MSAPAATEPDYNALLRQNLEHVFNERDEARRAEAVARLFVEEPVMYEPSAVLRSREAIADVAGKLLEQFGPSFRFAPVADAVGHHGLGSLRWQAGPEGGPIAVTGADIVEVVDGKISRLWVLLDPARP